MKKVSGNRQEGEKVGGGGGVGVGRAQEMHTRTHSVGQWSCKSRGEKSNMLAGHTCTKHTKQKMGKAQGTGLNRPRGGGGARGGQQPSVNMHYL